MIGLASMCGLKRSTGRDTLLMLLLSLILILGLPLLGIVLALVVAVMAAYHRDPLATITLAAISMTFCLFGVWWFIVNEMTLIKIGVAFGVTVALVACVVSWTRLRNSVEARMIRIRCTALGLSLIPLTTLVCAVSGYYAGGEYPDYFARDVVTNVESSRVRVAQNYGWFSGQILGIGIGCLVTVILLVVGRVLEGNRAVKLVYRSRW
jgi:uncharacterized membrane protein